HTITRFSMRRSTRFILATLCLFLPVVASGRPAPPAESPVAAAVDTTLGTASGQIRQFAFDGDADSFFASSQDARGADHFTLVLDRPVAAKSIAVATGRPGGGEGLDMGTLEVSGDGQAFDKVATFADGAARGDLDGRKVRAIRVRPAADLEHPLAIREIT